MLTGSSCAGGQILLCYIKSSSLKIIFSHSDISLLMLALAKDITADSDGLAAYDLQVAHGLVHVMGGHPSSNAPIVAITSCWCGTEHKHELTR